MPVDKINLVAPNHFPIVGILLEDNSICKFEYTYDNLSMQRDLILPKNLSARTVEREGDLVLVDSEGNEWRASDIEYHSILKS